MWCSRRCWRKQGSSDILETFNVVVDFGDSSQLLLATAFKKQRRHTNKTLF
jgi:hypothetical protein